MKALVRKIGAKLRGQKIVDPQTLLDHGRLDVASKTPLARAMLDRNTSVWPEELYRETIRAWNNFFEEHPNKSTYDDFYRPFHKIVMSMNEGSFRFAKAPVVVDAAGRLDNGSHRVAAAIATNNLIHTKFSKGATPGMWDHIFFRYWAKAGGEQGLAERYIDAMTIEYVTLRPKNLRAIIIFPAAHGKRKKAAKYINTFGTVVGYKQLPRESLNAKAVISQLYHTEWWCNDEYPEAVRNKAEHCFDGDDPLEVYLVETSASDKAMSQHKSHFRSWWRIENHSIHITDTEEEVITTSRMFFNENSRQFLSIEPKYMPKFSNYFDEFLRHAPREVMDRDRFCVDSSCVLAAFGLRDANDLDYLHRGAPLRYFGEGVESHNEWAGYYVDSIDEIVTNPEKHFYYKGVKFVSLNGIEAMKRKRDEPKDRKDVKLIERLRAAHNNVY